MDYAMLATKDIVDKTVKALTSKNVQPILVNNKTEALEAIKKLIPAGATVMNGSSKTLEEIGFVEYLKSGSHNWKNLHEEIVAEKDPVKQAALRKQAVLSEYYLGSVHAVTQEGEFIIASNSGSQLPHIVFTSQNLIFVVSTKKIVPNILAAMNRLEQYVVPLEDQNMMKKYGIKTSVNKIVVFKNENPMMGRKVYMILVQEDLGF